MSEYSFKENEYLVVGWAQGLMDTEEEDANGKKVNVQRPYYQLFVLSPVSSYKSDTYTACGLKAQKLRCASDAVWKNINPMEVCNLFFDEKKRVAMAVSTGEVVSLESISLQVSDPEKAPEGSSLRRAPPPLTGGHYLQKRHGGTLYG